MVVHDFNIDGFAVLPEEADPVPVVDSDAVLTGTVIHERLQLHARALEIEERASRVQEGQLAIGAFGNRPKLPGPEAVENLLRLGVFEAADHMAIVYRYAINIKGREEKGNRRKREQTRFQVINTENASVPFPQRSSLQVG